ncbi:MAG: PDDEXK nuclease domain-containing protein [Methanomicrobiales archaeon]|jgi:predicted nuclease of restriction endonuclease-like (RecB) superfamily|nr:PDDEXK nuclease domain-containing protein [Methanomicrobiales archaeon]
MMSKKRIELTITNALQIDESLLFAHVAEIIESRKHRAGAYANREITLMYWEIGKYISSALIDGERAEYGKQVLATLSQQLVQKYGKSFEYTKITRMIKFAKLFPDIDFLATLSQELSWSHFIEILPLKSEEARKYYANDAASRRLGVRELRNQISRKAYERGEIADTRINEVSSLPFNVFKDPYLLDVLDLKENFLEADLEKAILTELEKFILEFGHGFTFVERQKRMTMDSDDFTLDLLFYHRILKRLVAIELKAGKFMPQYAGQMSFYLKWLNKYERQEGENEPIGLILCTKASRNQIELMELDKSGIAVAQYWTNLPPKALLEEKIRSILSEAQERLGRRKLLSIGVTQKQLEYFYEPKDGNMDEE